MSKAEKFYPNAANLGNSCAFWTLESGCIFPKGELVGRRSCEGVIDDICLYLKNSRIPRSLTDAQRLEIRSRAPDRRIIPPGSTKP